MKFWLKLYIIVSCFLFSISGNAQVYHFKTSSLSVKDKDEKGKWTPWTDFKKAEIIITLDGKKDRFVVNSKDLQLFKINKYLEKVTNETDETLGFECEDNTGELCYIMIITRKKENNRKQFYIIYNDLKMVYNITDYI